MNSGGFIDALPIWTIFPITLIAALLSREVGYHVAKYRRERAKDRTEAPVAPVLAATLGLFAFLLAFTFGLAASRFEERRQVVLAESNAIGTAYLRAQALPEPMATNSRNLLREYVDVRLEGTNPVKTAQAITKSEELHKGLWAEAVGAAQKERSQMTSLFMQSLNDVINLHEKRLTAGLYNRIPGAIWFGLYLLLVLALAVVGYHEGIGGTRRSLAVLGLVLAFAAVLALIADLDRPGRGLLEVNQQSMVDLQKSMNAAP
ncbi:MAG TPA: hypothetical protein VKD91_04120 [Pyrinomonadaceae bacterium]|nr:hypothetical protein [Pyrinomonadaceae bacterium]